MREKANLSVHALLTAVCLTVAAQTAVSATLTVPTSHLTIQAAIDAAEAGDTVLVLPGIYHENIDFKGKGIAVVGQKGYRKTRIVGGPSGPVVLMESGEPVTAELSGFTVQGGRGGYGGGVSLASASPVIRNNRFTKTLGEYASGIGGNSSSPTIDGNLFEEQDCMPNDLLGGVMMFINSSSPRIVNNIVRGNNCAAIDLTLPEGNTPVVANNTLVDNDTGIIVDARINTRLQTFQNNIISGNRRGLHVLFLSAGDEPTFRNNNVNGNQTNYSGIADLTHNDGNLSVDPAFVDAANKNYRLSSGSPCIDSGAMYSGGKRGKDVYGAKRLIDGNADGKAKLDIGAAEYQPQR